MGHWEIVMHRKFQRRAQPPHRGLIPQNVCWNQAFDIWSTAAKVYKSLLREVGFGDLLKIKPIMISLPRYICALAERYFSETHTLHLDITSADCAKLLRLEGPTGVIFEGKVQLDALCPSNLDFSKDPTTDDRDWMLILNIRAQSMLGYTYGLEKICLTIARP
ncbi:unnamed protein product [Dovyalis caffra]|uniref:Uncharacterized protein n=1 Tax=Dovyalis caffra TaxID=77055 RepID=A0AAV1QUC8_9ROSI|nr:unnamed protein product [Dovyalis caffra]